MILGRSASFMNQEENIQNFVSERGIFCQKT